MMIYSYVVPYLILEVIYFTQMLQFPWSFGINVAISICWAIINRRLVGTCAYEGIYFVFTKTK